MHRVSNCRSSSIQLCSSCLTEWTNAANNGHNCEGKKNALALHVHRRFSYRLSSTYRLGTTTRGCCLSIVFAGLTFISQWTAGRKSYGRIDLHVIGQVCGVTAWCIDRYIGLPTYIAANQGLWQEAQLMLTNSRDAVRGQSRSPNIVPFHMLGIVSH